MATIDTSATFDKVRDAKRRERQAKKERVAGVTLLRTLDDMGALSADESAMLVKLAGVKRVRLTKGIVAAAVAIARSLDPPFAWDSADRAARISFCETHGLVGDSADTDTENDDDDDTDDDS